MIEELNEEGKKVGLKINKTKSYILTNSPEKQEIEIENQKINYVEEVICLGQKIAIENKTQKEVDRRITIA